MPMTSLHALRAFAIAPHAVAVVACWREQKGSIRSTRSEALDHQLIYACALQLSAKVLSCPPLRAPSSQLCCTRPNSATLSCVGRSCIASCFPVDTAGLSRSRACLAPARARDPQFRLRCVFVKQQLFFTSAAQVPPFSYAGLLAPSVALKTQAAAAMKQDHQVLLYFDRLRWTSPRAKPIWTAMEPLFPPSVRLLFCSYERDGYNANSSDGRAHLRTMCEHIPDSKCVEDLHEKIRDLRRLVMFNAGGTLQGRSRQAIQNKSKRLHPSGPAVGQPPNTY
jgi:hypothetical protein